MIIGGSGAKTPTSLLTGKRGLSYDVEGVQLTTGAKTIQLAGNQNLQTTLNVTGSGALTLVYFFSTVSTGGRIQITLDGVVVLNYTVTDYQDGIRYYGLSPVGSCYQGNGATAGRGCSRDYIPFSTSLKIECQAVNDGSSAYLAVDYQLTS